jgi:hypothetical protein
MMSVFGTRARARARHRAPNARALLIIGYIDNKVYNYLLSPVQSDFFFLEIRVNPEL